ncbi:uncharacterized protein LOC114754769 [Neltuma alba]|uniref:uncharacterized protein LOC114754769 n=1 Tax=Neltuma alba TaxID=207710 RepID=UPI0010A526E4|nr:uncharacterized protein LOC114754769 [Prosopis alba]
MFVRGRNKEIYLTKAPPASTDSQFATWCAENNLVMAWLINSMTADIGENYLLATTAKEIWDSAKATYSVTENTAALFQVKRQLHDLTKGDQTITQYYTALMKLWQQIDLYEVHEWPSTAAAMYYKKLVDQERCYKFLLGLDDSYEDVRARIMSLKPLPSLLEAFNTVKFEESRKVLITASNISSTSTNSSILAVNGPQSDPKAKKGNKWCDHCHKSGHTREVCWKLHGKPPNNKPRGKPGSKGMLVGVNSNETISHDELLLLRKFLDKHLPSTPDSENTTPSVTLAHAGLGIREEDWRC